MPSPDHGRSTVSVSAGRDGGSAMPEVRSPPASFAQQRLWFLDQLHPQRAAYNVYSAFRFTGPLSIDALVASLNAIVARHESLRTTFTEANSRDSSVLGGGPGGVSGGRYDGVRQSIAAALTIDVPLIELPDERTALQKLARDAAIPFDLHTGPLIRASLVRIAAPASDGAPPVHLLLLTTHHIVADGWSMTLLFQELAAIYPALLRGRLDALPVVSHHAADAIADRTRVSLPARREHA
jgi:hypothetical protein